MGGGGLSRLANMGPAWWLRLFFLSLLNGIGLWSLPFLLRDQQWLLAGALVVGVLGIDYIFLSPKGMPLRWLVPGLFFLLIMMIYPIFYTF